MHTGVKMGRGKIFAKSHLHKPGLIGKYLDKTKENPHANYRKRVEDAPGDSL
jgi:hypothetical protein